jgi:acyl-CoA synthetase (AMP-forming)/AMP-acid ligase II
VTTSNYCTLIEALLAAPPEKPFISVWNDEDDIESVSFGEFVRLAKLQAAAFRVQGLTVGDRVILILPQGISLMTAFAGAMMLGAVPAILAYPNFKADPDKYAAGLAGVTKNLRASLVVVDDEFSTGLSDHITMADGACLLRSVIPSLGSEEPALPEFSPDPQGLAFIQHSAGTTGLQ